MEEDIEDIFGRVKVDGEKREVARKKEMLGKMLKRRGEERNKARHK